MYYLIDLNQPLYSVIESSDTFTTLLDSEKFNDKTIIVNDDFLENYLTLIRESDVGFYRVSWRPEDVPFRSMLHLQEQLHFILILDKWETCAKLKFASDKYFSFKTTEGIEIIMKHFREGDPY